MKCNGSVETHVVKHAPLCRATAAEFKARCYAAVDNGVVDSNSMIEWLKSRDRDQGCFYFATTCGAETCMFEALVVWVKKTLIQW